MKILSPNYHLATPAMAAAARRAMIYRAEKFSDHAPLTIEYDMALWPDRVASDQGPECQVSHFRTMTAMLGAGGEDPQFTPAPNRARSTPRKLA